MADHGPGQPGRKTGWDGRETNFQSVPTSFLTIADHNLVVEVRKLFGMDGKLVRTVRKLVSQPFQTIPFIIKTLIGKKWGKSMIRSSLVAHVPGAKTRSNHVKSRIVLKGKVNFLINFIDQCT